MTIPEITVPAHLLPADGRFGSGPTRIRPAQVEDLVARSTTLLGTSHRKTPVTTLVGSVRERLGALLGLPAGYEVVLGNGGATTFWDTAAFGLVLRRSQNCVFGAFSAKFADALRTPFCETPQRVEAPFGRVALPQPDPDVDVYAWPHNETSTGVRAAVERVGTPDQLVMIDATSAAGALPVDLSQTDVYYFSPQKAFGSDGGLWFAVLSPAAVERAERLQTDRWAPPTLRLHDAVVASRKNQTLNTPALATLLLMDSQLGWMLDHGGLAWSSARVAAAAAELYAWAQASSWLRPFVADPALRSPCVATLEVDPTVDATRISAVLRRAGVVDVDPYRGVGSNQLRIGMFPAVDPADVTALTRCLDFVAERV